ncbi:hypothetical protein JM946_28790 [Steroidobacter sp. S1-65]|uniref:Uncharacterized protein n=1 Tax=Steroidobacter gossypii TaxID=2805490 RepID=A0ABS1X697_9GAMM|nr:hypothetical protein [Steroidobacter gossypii]MBM0108749.1 hypothetical protein [Steroidobacter gossypii]
MTPADRRITELIDKWLTSIDLHLQYVELSDAAYARVQPWQKHDRPTRWVLEVARQKVLELKQHCETRQAMGDSKFSESLELMAFLANLVGIQHIQRFIPLADPAKADAAAGTSQTVEAPTVIRAGPRPRAAAEEPTREMPQLKAVRIKPDEVPLLEPSDALSTEELIAPVAVPARSIPSNRPAPKINPAAVQPAKPSRPAAPAETPKLAPPTDLKGKIIADAVRLLKWGKPWHELAELIARIAERPSAAEIRKVLRAHKAEIEKAAQV